jgi:DNA-binding NarL/FixJ family response regulator
MTHSALIVCESHGLWARALRRAMEADPVRLVETRRAADCWQELHDAPASLVALAWSGQRRTELAEFADRIGRRWPLVRLVVLVDRRDRADAQLAYELGATFVASSPRQAPAVVRIAWRHLGRNAALRHWQAMDEAIEQVWQTLPWNFHDRQERID